MSAPAQLDFKRHLLIFMDTETTGLDVQKEEIIEIAMKVDPRCMQLIKTKKNNEIAMPSESFSSLIRPQKGNIPEAASKIHGITMKEMEGQMPFLLVLVQVFLWLHRWMAVAKADFDHILLVGHNSDRFDKIILLRQIEEHKEMKKNMPKFIKFGDTLPHLRYLFSFPGRSFKQESLWNLWCKKKKGACLENTKQSHRALSDVEMLIDIVLMSPDTKELTSRLIENAEIQNCSSSSLQIFQV